MNRSSINKCMNMQISHSNTQIHPGFARQPWTSSETLDFVWTVLVLQRMTCRMYPLVNYLYSYEESSSEIGKSTVDEQFSAATLTYQRVTPSNCKWFQIWMYHHVSLTNRYFSGLFNKHTDPLVCPCCVDTVEHGIAVWQETCTAMSSCGCT